MEKKVISQFEAIRRMGQIDMLDKVGVQRIAYENSFYELVNAIEEGEYSKILSEYSKLIKKVSEKDIPTAYPIETRYKLRK